MVPGKRVEAPPPARLALAVGLRIAQGQAQLT